MWADPRALQPQVSTHCSPTPRPGQKHQTGGGLGLFMALGGSGGEGLGSHCPLWGCGGLTVPVGSRYPLWGLTVPYGISLSFMESHYPLWGLTVPCGVSLSPMGSHCPLWGLVIPYGVSLPPPPPQPPPDGRPPRSGGAAPTAAAPGAELGGGEEEDGGGGRDEAAPTAVSLYWGHQNLQRPNKTTPGTRGGTDTRV